MAGNQQQYYILVTGLMSSGKSTIMREYCLNFPIEEFQEPPVKVQFNGLDFQFIDATFAIHNDKAAFNFYELDAPTIRKWYQFVQVADAIIIVYNQKPNVMYGTHPELRDAILSSAKQNVPIFIIANNATDLESGKIKVEEEYQTSKYSDINFEVLFMPSGENFFDEKYGRRIKLDQNQLKSIFDRVMQKISNDL